MSFLSRSYLSPPTPPPVPPSQTAPPPPETIHQSTTHSPIAKPNSRSPLPLFLAGLTFTTLSLLLTRRTLRRRRLGSLPKFYNPPYHPSLGPSYPPPNSAPINGAVEAFEALSLASINVASFGLLAVGGGLWWWDIRGMSDLRRKVRMGMGVGTGEGERGEKDADEEMEEWIAAVLKRREEKVRNGGRGRGKDRDRDVE